MYHVSKTKLLLFFVLLQTPVWKFSLLKQRFWISKLFPFVIKCLCLGFHSVSAHVSRMAQSKLFPFEASKIFGCWKFSVHETETSLAFDASLVLCIVERHTAPSEPAKKMCSKCSECCQGSRHGADTASESDSELSGNVDFSSLHSSEKLRSKLAKSPQRAGFTFWRLFWEVWTFRVQVRRRH